MNIVFIRGLGEISCEIIQSSTFYNHTSIIVHQGDVQNHTSYTQLCDVLGDTIAWYRGDYARPDLIRQICRDYNIDLVVYDLGDGKGQGGYQVFLDHIASVTKMCSQLSQCGVKKIMIMGNYHNPSRHTYDVACIMNQLMFESLSLYEGRNVVVLQGGENTKPSDFVPEFHRYVGVLQQGLYPRYEHCII